MLSNYISQVATVFVPVSDQDAALDFYVNKLGFEKRIDSIYGAGAHRWIEVCPPGSTYALALVPPSEGNVAPGDHTYCALLSTDVDATHAALRDAGVNVDPIAREGSSRTGLNSVKISVHDPAPPQFLFRDLDGNRFLVVSQG